MGTVNRMKFLSNDPVPLAEKEDPNEKVSAKEIEEELMDVKDSAPGKDDIWMVMEDGRLSVAEPCMIHLGRKQDSSNNFLMPRRRQRVFDSEAERPSQSVFYANG